MVQGRPVGRLHDVERPVVSGVVVYVWGCGGSTEGAVGAEGGEGVRQVYHTEDAALWVGDAVEANLKIPKNLLTPPQFFAILSIPAR